MKLTEKEVEEYEYLLEQEKTGPMSMREVFNLLWLRKKLEQFPEERTK
jgi:hypothetical protein